MVAHRGTLHRAEIGVYFWKLPRLPRRPYPRYAHQCPSPTSTFRTPSQPTSRSSLPTAAGCSSIVQPNGSKLWRLRYFFLGKERSLSIGPYPIVSLADARAKRDEAKKQILAGTDPSVQKKLDRIAAETASRNTFGAVAAEYIANLEANGKAAITLQKNRWLLQDLTASIANRPDRRHPARRDSRPPEAHREKRPTRDGAPVARRHRRGLSIGDRHPSGDQRPDLRAEGRAATAEFEAARRDHRRTTNSAASCGRSTHSMDGRRSGRR